MPRRRPGAVRLDRGGHPLDAQGRPEGLSTHGRRVVAALEDARAWRGRTSRALTAYRLALCDPAHRLWDPQYGCGVSECCPDPVEERWWLEVVLRHLPPRDRRRFARRLRDLDASW